MKHRIVSLYKSDLPQEIVQCQKKVFNFLSISLEQIPFEGAHSWAIEDCIKKYNDWDSITIFDVDCIPLSKNCIDRALKEISDDNTLYGNIQASNTSDINKPRTPPFVAPSFINFTKKFWETSAHKKFDFCWHQNPDGIKMEADVAEVFTIENRKKGRRIVAAYPTRCLTVPEWRYLGGHGYEPFDFGVATEFSSETYHNFQIRIPSKQKYFIKYCDELIQGKITHNFVNATK